MSGYRRNTERGHEVACPALGATIRVSGGRGRVRGLLAGLVDTEGAMSKWWLLAVLGGVVVYLVTRKARCTPQECYLCRECL